MPPYARDSHEASRRKLLGAVADAPDLTFIRPFGNIGDHLIYAGTRQLLSGLSFTEVSVRKIESVRGHTAILGGGGSWCGPYHDMPAYLPLIEERFERVIIFPSSFSVSVPSVRQALARSKALVFAREQVSYDQIRDLCHVEMAHDCALYFNYRPYRRAGEGVLTVFREDAEADSREIPAGNWDISLYCETLDEWLWTIARHAVVRTNRAHVTIAAALLGKRVEYGSSSYHKVPAIVEHSLPGFPVTRLEDSADLHQTADPSTLHPARGEGLVPSHHASTLGSEGYADWDRAVRRLTQDLAGVVP